MDDRAFNNCLAESDKERAMYDDEGIELVLLGYLVGDDDLWDPGERERESEGEEPPKKRRWWTRPWIGRKDDADVNTMYKLQLEISEVGLSSVVRE